MKNILTGILTLAVFAQVFVGSVNADGEKKTVCTTTYGGGTECQVVDVPQEKIVHTPVETGVVENTILAASMFGLGYGLLILAKHYSKA